MNTNYTVGQYLVDRLYELGLEYLFSIAGDYSIHWLNNYVRPSRITVINEVNELNAGYAADGYARLNGIGALCVTYSAGSLSATNAIAGAYVEKVPVVLINGTPSIKDTLRFEQTGYSSHHFISGRQTDLQVFEYITAAAIRIDNPDLAPMLIDYALTQCITERQPVYIELLEDMVDLPCKFPEGELKPARSLPDTDGVTQAIAKIKDKLQAAAKPLIWLGPEIDRFGLQQKTEDLIRQLKLPFVTELLSKAVLSENDPQFAGVFDGQASSAEVQTLAKESDFILGLGVWLTDINTVGWDPDFENTAFASFDTFKYGAFFMPQVPLGNLIDGLIAQNITCKPRDLPQTTSPANPKPKPEDQITYQGFYDFIPEFIIDTTIVGSDASMNYFGSVLLKVHLTGGFVSQSSYSAIGYIGPAATGLCLAKEKSQRVMVFSGDGGFQMTAQCLSTQTNYKLNPIIFVIDNGVFAVEQWLADASIFPDQKAFYEACLLKRWNYDMLSKVFECKGWRVEKYGDLRTAIAEALENLDSPSIIQVLVPKWSTPDNSKFKKN